MYAVSEAYRAALAAPGRTEKIGGKITLAGGTVLPLSDSVLKAGSLTVDNRCVNGEELEFGAVYAGQLTLTMDSDADRYAFYDAEIALEWALRLADGSWETLPMGVYTVTEAVRQGRYLALTALDCLMKFETAFDGAAILGTPFEVLSYLCRKAGVALANTEAEIAALPNGGEECQLGSTENLSTWRDGVALIAQLLGCFATATRDGTLRLCPFGTETAAVLPAKSRFSTELSDYQTAYRGLEIQTEDGMLESWAEAENGLVMVISGNALFGKGLAETRQARADRLRVMLCGIVYTPCSVTMNGDPALECGDRLILADAAVGAGKTENTATLLTGYRWAYRGRESLESVGKNPRLTGVKNKTERTAATLQNQMSNDRLSVNYFVNPAEISLAAGGQKKLMSMAVTTTRQTSVVFWAEALLTVAESADGQELQLQYQQNGANITTFTPRQTLHTGQQLLNLMLPLVGLEAESTVRLNVYATVSGGSCTIPAEGLRAMMQGQGLAGAVAWDGTLTFHEDIGLVAAGPAGAGPLALAEELTADAVLPKALPIREEIGLWLANADPVALLGLNETCTQEIGAGS